MRPLFLTARLVYILVFGYAELTATQQQCPLPKKPADTPVWITVFIHGTVRAEWVFNSLYQVLTDSVEGSTYEKAVTVVRNDPHFFQLHAMQEPGLRKIEMKEEPPIRGATAIAQLYDQITALAQPTPTINYYYTFGWSGLMSEKKRFEESQQLYTELGKEIKKISSDHHVTPRIRLIAYSHGGNVCLNLAQAKKDEHESCFCVEELVLLGSPVQPHTDYLVADPMFKKVYSFYSPDDMVQPLDIFSARKSHRTFKKRTHFAPPDKLKQISVKVAHYKPRQQRKQLSLPMPLKYKKDEIKKAFMNPGHIELWYLGWAASLYRTNFPLHPFPVVDFVSFITAHVDQAPTLGNMIDVTLYPQQEVMRMHDRSHHQKKTVSFLPIPKIEQLKVIAHSYKPNEKFYQEHRERLANALTFGKACKNGGVVQILKEDGSYYKIAKEAMCLH